MPSTSETRSTPDGRSPPDRRRRRVGLIALCGAAALLLVGGGAFALLYPQDTPEPIASFAAGLSGANPHPVHLLRPPAARLSALAQLGRDVFFDASLSASGRQSCASCHSPERDYGPPNGRSVQLGGPHTNEQGVRPPPSLAYLYRQPPFSIGPDAGDLDTPPTLIQLADRAKGTPRAAKVAGAAPAAPAVVPQGGMFWDGRSNTLQMQASGPMMDPDEMANTSEAEVAGKLAHARYAAQFVPLFGARILHEPSLLVSEAMSAVARYQVEDPSFHRFDSKYDAWLEGKARLAPSELRGLKLFDDRSKANCAGCHLSAPGRDGLPPLFTDTQYEALAVPRNTTLAVNRDPTRFDLGLCGPYRHDLSTQTQYCGMFLTPTLRNAARRQVFFHNGVYHSLDDVLRFYALRDVRPDLIYPRDAAGRVLVYDDIPERYRANVDRTDAPFDRKPGEAPAMSAADRADIVAFLRTLDDGYRP